MKIAPITPLSYSKNNNLQKKAHYSNSTNQISNSKPSFAYENYGKNLISFESNLSQVIGHKKEKDEIKNKIITPVVNNCGKNQKITPVFLFYGADEDFINKAIIELKKELKKDANFISLSNLKSENFEENIKHILYDAKINYLNSNKMTLVHIDEAEKFLSIHKKEANTILDFSLDDNDLSFLEQNENCANNINLMKSMADFSSKRPTSLSSNGNATVFVLTSKFPHLIHPDLLTRDGKVKSIYFEPDNKKNFELILKNNIKKAKKKLEQIKKADLRKIENENLPYKSHRNLLQLMKNNNQNKLNIDIDKIPFYTLAQLNAPSENLGAFDNNDIENIVNLALYDYIANPKAPFENHLAMKFANEKRSIAAKQYAKDKRIQEIISPQNLGLNYSEQIRKEYYFNVLEEKENCNLAEIIFKENVEKIILNNKVQNNNVTNEQINRLQELEELTRNDDHILANEDIKIELSKIVNERTIRQSNDRFRFYYLDAPNNYVDLYLSEFGTNKNALWVDSDNATKLEIVLTNTDFIKQNDVFSEIKTLKFPSKSKPEKPLNAEPVDEFTLDKIPIYEIKT